MSKGSLYLAAPWADRDEMEARATVFEIHGWRITHRWWDYEGGDEREERHEFLEQCAKLDFYGVIAAHVVILFNSAKSEGKSVEQGIALANKIPIIAIGTRGEFSANVFHYLNDYVWVADIDNALKVLEGVL